MDSNFGFRPLTWATHAPSHVPRTPQTPQPERGPEAASSPLSAEGGLPVLCLTPDRSRSARQSGQEEEEEEEEGKEEKQRERQDSDKKHPVLPVSPKTPVVEQGVAEAIGKLKTKTTCNDALVEADAAVALLDLAAQRPPIVEQRPCSSSKESRSHAQPGDSESNPSLKSKPAYSTIAGDCSVDNNLAESCTLDDGSSVVSIGCEEEVVNEPNPKGLVDLRQKLRKEIEVAVGLLVRASLLAGAAEEFVKGPDASSGDRAVALEVTASLSPGMSHDNDVHQSRRPDPTHLQHEIQKVDKDLERGRSMTPKDLTMTSIHHGNTGSQSPHKAESPHHYTVEQTPHQQLPAVNDLIQRLVEEISKQWTASSYVGADAEAATWSATPPDLRYIQYEVRKEDIYLDQIRQLISKDLSEPYSIYVYRYFLNQWPNLCFMALAKDSSELRGVIVCKLETHRSGTYRGYIAMLATAAAYRGQGIASHLIVKAIDAMRALDADEIVLETEVTNPASLRLYERLGFLRTKRLHRYYLSGNDAFRLALYLKPGVGMQGRQKQQLRSDLSSFHQSSGL